MSHRLQLVLTDAQYSFLDAESDRSSVSIAELVRRALDTVYGPKGERRSVVISHDVGRRSGLDLERYARGGGTSSGATSPSQ